MTLAFIKFFIFYYGNFILQFFSEYIHPRIIY